MRQKTMAFILAWLAAAVLARAGTTDVTTLVQQGLFEEEANHHLDAAMEFYQEAIGKFDADRKLAATAIFHLGECYRLQGKTNEANIQYERIVHEFQDQPELVKLSKSHLPVASVNPSFTSSLVKISDGGSELSPEERDEIRNIENMIRNSPDLLESGGRLTTAAQNGWMSAAKLLVDNGVSVNPSNSGAFTPLTAAAMAGNNGMVEFLLASGAKPNDLNGNGFSALAYAVEMRYKTVAVTLIARGADVNLPNRDGDRPLHFAAYNGSLPLAAILREHNADINASGKDGQSPLFRAIRGGNMDMVRFLIDHGANVKFQAAAGETPLLYTVERGDINGSVQADIVNLLADEGADVNAVAGGHHPLDTAVAYGRTNLVKILLSKKADANVAGRWNVLVHPKGLSTFNRAEEVTPLILAVDANDGWETASAPLLLDALANPNLPDETGATPLDFAINRGWTNIIRELIAHHADVNQADNEGDPPLAYVLRSGFDYETRDDMKDILVQAGANEDYLRRGGIFATQKGSGSIGTQVFSTKNSANQFTLLELVAQEYENTDDGAVPFPDLEHVTINRLQAGGKNEEIPVDLESILNSGDCSKNLVLESGDVVTIPELDHGVNESWEGLTDVERTMLGNCLMRRVKIVVKGHAADFILLPPIVELSAKFINNGGTWYWGKTGRDLVQLEPLSDVVKGKTVLYTFNLDSVVHQANLLLISSDLSRVKLIRTEPGNRPAELEYNLEPTPSSPGYGVPGIPSFRPGRFLGMQRSAPSVPQIQLQDGDVIEIPERGENK